MATYYGQQVHRTAYVWGRRRVLACPPCRREQPGRKATKVTRRQLRAMFVPGFRLTDRSPAFCANCCAPINVR